MKVKALLYAYQNGKEREINIPDAEIEANCPAIGLLELAFRYGQNDFQNVRGCCSVSVNDVILLPDGEAWRVLGSGWERAS